MNLTKKMGPLPVWAWGLIIGIGAYYFYSRSSSGSTTTSSSPTSSVLDPNAVDPNTGLTYGEEESAALNSNAMASSGAGGGDSGSAGLTDSGAQSTVTPTNEFGDFLTFMGEWSQVAQAMGWQAPGTQLTSTPQSPTTSAAASSPPLANGNTPTVTATAHTSPAQTAQVNQSTAVLGQLTGLINSGFKKVAGSTQSGGLPQTGTYTYTPPKGASQHTGPTKYFVYGTASTGYQIRAAA